MRSKPPLPRRGPPSAHAPRRWPNRNGPAGAVRTSAESDGFLRKACAQFWVRPVETVDTAAALAALRPIWTKTPESAMRVRGRIEAVLNAAKAEGMRTGENPAAWRNHLAHLLPNRQAIEPPHHPAMNYDDLPWYIAELRALSSMAARALEFLILTAARAREVLDMTWKELDLAERTWSVPASRMKAGKVHRVPLSAPAMAILEWAGELRTSALVFPGHARGRRMSTTTLARLLEGTGVTLFRLRSSTPTGWPKRKCLMPFSTTTTRSIIDADGVFQFVDIMDPNYVVVDDDDVVEG